LVLCLGAFLYEFFDLLGVFSKGIESTGETMQDGDDIGNKLLVVLSTILVENHDFAVMDFTQPFNEVEPEPSKSVFVGNHNNFDISFENSSQKGEQSFPPKIESSCHFLIDTPRRKRRGIL